MNAQISQREDERNTYVIIQAMYPSWTRPASVRFKVWFLCDCFFYIPSLVGWLLFDSLVLTYKTIHHVPDCISCHKTMVVITGRQLRKKACLKKFRHFFLSIIFFTIHFLLLHLKIHNILQMIQEHTINFMNCDNSS